MNHRIIPIAIADDHMVVRVGIKGVLEQDPSIQVVQEYECATDLLQDIHQAEWKILILDIDLKDGNGIEVTGQILKQRPDIGILILSIYPEDQYGLRALKAGAMGYLNKDFIAAKLIEAIQRIAEGKKYVGPELADLLATQAIAGGTYDKPHERLSNRELQVLCLLASGKSNLEIASTLFVSPKTVSTYRIRMLAKMQLSTTADLISYALRHNLMDHF